MQKISLEEIGNVRLTEMSEELWVRELNFNLKVAYLRSLIVKSIDGGIPVRKCLGHSGSCLALPEGK